MDRAEAKVLRDLADRIEEAQNELEVETVWHGALGTIAKEVHGSVDRVLGERRPNHLQVVR